MDPCWLEEISKDFARRDITVNWIGEISRAVNIDSQKDVPARNECQLNAKLEYSDIGVVEQLIYDHKRSVVGLTSKRKTCKKCGAGDRCHTFE